MGLDFNSVAEYRFALDKFIDDAMDNEIAEKVQLALMDSIEENVYGAYSPEYTGRPGTIKSPRRIHGGLKDRANLLPTYIPSTKTLIVEAVAPWQNVGFFHTNGRGTYDNSLAEVIEESGMYGAPPRPFTWIAEEKYAKKLGRDLKSALVKRGL